jgi:hypothetical protein
MVEGRRPREYERARKEWPNTVAHFCNPSYLGDRDRKGHHFESNQGKKVNETHISAEKNLGMCLSSYVSRKLVVQVCLGKNS